MNALIRHGVTALAGVIAMLHWRCVEGPSAAPDPADVCQGCTTAVALDRTAFDSLVIDRGLKAVVEFYSPRCGVCGSMVAVIESLAVAFGDSLLVAMFNVDSDDSLWRRYVTSVPTYVLFDSGAVRASLSFTQNQPWAYDSLAALVRALLAGTLGADTTPPDTLPLPDSLAELTKENFAALVAVPGRLAMVEFYSPLCGGCLSMIPVVDTIVARYEGRALIGRVNVLEDDTLWRAFNVGPVPTFVFLRGGVEYARLVGATSADTLAARIEQGLAKRRPETTDEKGR